MSKNHENTNQKIKELLDKGFQLREDSSKLEDEIKVWEEILEYQDLPEYIKSVSSFYLGEAILFRYKKSLKPVDLDQSIVYLIEGENLMNNDEKQFNREICDRLGEAFTLKHNQSQDIKDLNQAIKYMVLAVKNSEKEDQHYFELVVELLRLYVTRYVESSDNQKSVDDLNRAIELGQKATNLLPEDSNYLSFILQNLSKAYLERHDLTNEEEDLKNAITALVQLTSVVSQDDPRFEYGTVMLKVLQKAHPDVFSELQISFIETEDVSAMQEIYDLLLNNKLDEAILKVDEDLSKYPDDDILLLLHSFLAAANDGNPVCAQILNRVKESDPGKERFMTLVSSSESSWNQKHGFRKVETIPDHVDISKIEITADNEAMSHRIRGQLYAQKGDYDKAIEEYTMAIELDQTNEVFFLNRGGIYHEMGNDDLAIQDFSKAIQLNPNLIDAYFNRGEAKRSKEDYKGAIEDYSKGIELEPDDYEFYLRRALAYSGIEEFDMVIKDCKKVIELEPNNFQARYYRGDAYRRKNEFELAIKDFKKALAINPNHIEAVDAEYSLGLANLNVENSDEALNNFLSVLKKDPNHNNAQRQIGAIYAGKGEYRKAIDYLTKVIETNPNSYEAHMNRGVSYLKLDQLDQAEHDIYTAKSINNSDPITHRTIASLQLKKGDYSSALDTCIQAIQLFPNDNSFHILKAKVFNALGDEEAAISEFRIALEREGVNPDNLLNGQYPIDQLLGLIDL